MLTKKYIAVTTAFFAAIETIALGIRFESCLGSLLISVSSVNYELEVEEA